MIGHLLAWVSLAGIYLLALARFAPWDLAIAGLLSAALLLSFRHILRRPRSDAPGSLGRLAAALPLAAIVTKNSIAGAWQVARALLSPRHRHPALVEVPLGERSPAGAAASSLLVALTPGTLLVDVDEERGVMLIHFIDAPDERAAVRAQQELYERHQRRVWP